MSTRPGFTLVELLAAIAIIGVLAAILLPAVAHVRAKGRATTCLSNLRQIGTATHLYIAENPNRLPSSSHQRAPDGTLLSWTHTLARYLGPAFLGRCPSVPEHPARITYGWNDLLTETDGQGIPFGSCRTPAATLVVAELAPTQTAEHLHFQGAARGRVTLAMFQSFVNVECHGARANYLFVDGHVATLAWADVQRRLAEPASPLVQP